MRTMFIGGPRPRRVQQAAPPVQHTIWTALRFGTGLFMDHAIGDELVELPGDLRRRIGAVCLVHIPAISQNAAAATETATESAAATAATAATNDNADADNNQQQQVEAGGGAAAAAASAGGAGGTELQQVNAFLAQMHSLGVPAAVFGVISADSGSGATVDQAAFDATVAALPPAVPIYIVPFPSDTELERTLIVRSFFGTDKLPCLATFDAPGNSINRDAFEQALADLDDLREFPFRKTSHLSSGLQLFRSEHVSPDLVNKPCVVFCRLFKDTDDESLRAVEVVFQSAVRSFIETAGVNALTFFQTRSADELRALNVRDGDKCRCNRHVLAPRKQFDVSTCVACDQTPPAGGFLSCIPCNFNLCPSCAEKSLAGDLHLPHPDLMLWELLVKEYGGGRPVPTAGITIIGFRAFEDGGPTYYSVCNNCTDEEQLLALMLQVQRATQNTQQRVSVRVSGQEERNVTRYHGQ